MANDEKRQLYHQEYYKKNRGKIRIYQQVYHKVNYKKRVEARREEHLCTACGRSLPEGDLRVQCQICQDRKNKYREKNRKHLTEVARMRRREVVFNHYGKVCACCGESNMEFLTMDHINGGGHKQSKERSGHLYLWLIKNNFPEGFRTLCYNCNCARANHNGICPHKF